MELVNLKNGQHIQTVQWKTTNLKQVKDFVNSFVKENQLPITMQIARDYGDNADMKIHYVPTLNHSLTIFYIIKNKNQTVKHYILTIPAHDFVTLDGSVPTMDSLVKVTPNADVVQNYKKLAVHQKTLVNNQTGASDICYQWSGKWNSLPVDLYTSITFDQKFYIDDNHNLIIHYGSQTFKIKPKSWLVFPSSNFGYFELDDMQIETSEQLKKDFHVPRAVQLPKYIFSVTKSTGDYSDRTTRVVGSASTYQGAKEIMEKARRLFLKFHHDDCFDDDDVDYNINPNKTRNFKKNDLI